MTPREQASKCEFSPTVLKYDGSATISSKVFRSFPMIGWKGVASAAERLCKALIEALRISRMGEVRQHSNAGTTKKKEKQKTHTQTNACL